MISVADQLGRSVLSVRPRVSKLYRPGKIRPTMCRIKNASGLKATGTHQHENDRLAALAIAIKNRAGAEPVLGVPR
jgi:hypothetical protein